ncbi:MAG: hypothetical protein P4M11_01390 [Candidatus Pacebacteria bacterium]|nr:hypothetical protein [Candidatus Paceibacterota bacterium]
MNWTPVMYCAVAAALIRGDSYKTIGKDSTAILGTKANRAEIIKMLRSSEHLAEFRETVGDARFEQVMEIVEAKKRENDQVAEPRPHAPQRTWSVRRF